MHTHHVAPCDSVGEWPNTGNCSHHVQNKLHCHSTEVLLSVMPCSDRGASHYALALVPKALDIIKTPKPTWDLNDQAAATPIAPIRSVPNVAVVHKAGCVSSWVTRILHWELRKWSS